MPIQVLHIEDNAGDAEGNGIRFHGRIRIITPTSGAVNGRRETRHSKCNDGHVRSIDPADEGLSQ